MLLYTFFLPDKNLPISSFYLMAFSVNEISDIISPEIYTPTYLFATHKHRNVRKHEAQVMLLRRKLINVPQDNNNDAILRQ